MDLKIARNGRGIRLATLVYWRAGESAVCKLGELDTFVYKLCANIIDSFSGDGQIYSGDKDHSKRLLVIDNSTDKHSQLIIGPNSAPIFR